MHHSRANLACINMTASPSFFREGQLPLIPHLDSNIPILWFVFHQRLGGPSGEHDSPSLTAPKSQILDRWPHGHRTSNPIHPDLDPGHKTHISVADISTRSSADDLFRNYLPDTGGTLALEWWLHEMVWYTCLLSSEYMHARKSNVPTCLRSTLRAIWNCLIPYRFHLPFYLVMVTPTCSFSLIRPTSKGQATGCLAGPAMVRIRISSVAVVFISSFIICALFSVFLPLASFALFRSLLKLPLVETPPGKNSNGHPVHKLFIALASHQTIETRGFPDHSIARGRETA